MPARRVSFALIVLAVALRVAAILLLRSYVVPRSTYEHGEIAANLLAGRGFSTRFLGADGPTSQQAPIYPLIVAASYAIGGIETPQALLLLQLTQAVLGGVLVAGVLSLARELAPDQPKVAIAAGLLAAIHPTLIYSATHVQVASLAAALLTWTLALAYRAGRTGRDRDAMIAGLVLGLLILTDPILSLVAPAIVMVIAARRSPNSGSFGEFSVGPTSVGPNSTVAIRLDPCKRRVLLVPTEDRGNEDGAIRFSRVNNGLFRDIDKKARLKSDLPDSQPLGKAKRYDVRPRNKSAGRSVAILGLMAAMCVAPWIARNFRVHGEFIFVKSTFGYAFWQGNCALSQGTDKVQRLSIEEALKPKGTSLEDWNRALWKARHEAGYIDDIALTKADYAILGKLTEPARSRLLLQRALKNLLADPWRYPKLCVKRLRYFVLFDETNPKTRSLVYRTSHVGLTLLAFIGVIVMPAALRRRLVPTFLTAGLIAAFHVFTLVSARFHVPLEPLMAVCAAGSLAKTLSASPTGNVVGVVLHHRLSVKKVLSGSLR